jgi:hypothetical protein
MLYEHGIHTSVYPAFGGELLGRGDAYVRALLAALELIVTDPRLRTFYEAFDIRIGVYGDYRRALNEMGHAALADRYAEVIEATAQHTTHRLLYGLRAEDATASCAAYSVDFSRRAGRAPSRAEVVRAYYGADIQWLDFYIGFERPVVFDVPLLLGPETALYFTRAPSLGLSARALRAMLYDLLYVRPVSDPDGLLLDDQALRGLRAYYSAHRDDVLGLGQLNALGYWQPVDR